MAGNYCKFCGRRCFVYRVVPNSHITHLATCPEGMKFDQEILGFDHTTAMDPSDPEQVEQYKRTGRTYHTEQVEQG